MGEPAAVGTVGETLGAPVVVVALFCEPMVCGVAAGDWFETAKTLPLSGHARRLARFTLDGPYPTERPEGE